MRLSNRIAMTILLSQFAFINQSHALEAYNAEYKFKINKRYSGVAKRSLTKINATDWSYKVNAKAAVGIASAYQESFFSQKKGVLKPSKNVIKYQILFKEIDTLINFDYPSKTVKVVHEGKKKSYEMPPMAQDALTMEVQVREDMINGGLRPHYYIADRNKIKKVSFKNMGLEKLTVPAGTFDVVKISLQHKNPKRKTYFYLSPKLKYLPIKIYQDDKGKVYDFQLKNFK